MRLPLLLPALLLAGCQSGPGAKCTPCEQLPAVADAAGPFAQAASAAAKGGQEVSNAPTQTDPARINPNVLASSGAGAATWTKSDSETRRLTGAASTAQGLVIPTSADARTGGGVSPVVASLQSYVEDLRAALTLELTNPAADPQKRKELMAEIQGAVRAMAEAQASTAGTTTNNFNFQNSRNVLTSGNSSNSGEGDAASDLKAGAMRAAPEAAKAVMNAPEPAPATPESSPQPPAPAAPAPSFPAPADAPAPEQPK